MRLFPREGGRRFSGRRIDNRRDEAALLMLSPAGGRGNGDGGNIDKCLLDVVIVQNRRQVRRCGNGGG